MYLTTLKVYISYILAGYYDLYTMDKKKYKKELEGLKKRLKDIPLKKLRKLILKRKHT